MDAKKVLECLSRSPPHPISSGCARSGLRPFLRSMQLIGSYHEHRHYADIDETGKHYMSAADNQNDDLLVLSASQKKTVTLALDPPSLDSRNKLFTRSVRAPTIFVNNGGALNEGSNDLRRRDTAPATQISDCEFPVQYEPLTPDNMEYVRHLDPCRRSNSFFFRCGILDKNLPQELSASLGFDLPKVIEGTEDEEMRKTSSSSSSSCLRNVWSDRTYSVIILLCHWINFFRCGMFINNKNRFDIMTALIPILWFLLVASFNTNLFISSFRRDHFREFFTKWAILFQDPTTRALGLRGVTTCTATKVCLWIQWLTTVVNMACLVFLMCMEDSFSAGMNYIFYFTGERSIASIVVSASFMIFITSSWIGTICFIALLCHHVKKHFHEFNRILHLHIAASGIEFPPTLNLLRERHLAMCDHVTVLDRYMSLAIGIALSIFISIGCLLLYQVVRVPMDISVMAINIMWLGSSLLLTAVSTYSMADVSVAMHSCSDNLFAVQTSHMTTEQLGQLQLFLAKVNGPTMGFTVLGLVVVTRELMLTLFGIYLTYGIVLLQFP